MQVFLIIFVVIIRKITTNYINMKKILGLDLGVGSIGWAYVHESENENEQSDIVRMGVKISSLTKEEKSNFEKGKSVTANATRTLARSMRRNLQRYKLRREVLKSILMDNNLIANSDVLLESGNATTFQTYKLRAKAVTERVELDEFSRVLFMINKKRGYKSSRKVKSDENGVAIDEIAVAEQLYNEDMTPGEYVWSMVFSVNKRYIPSFYASDLRSELERIWNYQSAFYPDVLTDELKEKIQNKTITQTSKIFLADKGIYLAENKGKDRKRYEYNWRYNGLRKCLELGEIAYIISSINGEITKSSGYLGAISDNSKVLLINKLTVGQYLAKQIEEQPNKSLKNIIFYRQDYLNEFEAIWEQQAKHYPQLTPSLKKHIRDTIIFYQRPLKSQKGLLSYCEFESNEVKVNVDGKIKTKKRGLKVAPKSSPLFQEFKIWQVLNNIIVSDNASKEQFELSEDDKLRLFEELTYKEKISQKEFFKLLGLNVKQYSIKYKEIEGNRTMSAIYRACCGVLAVNGYDTSAYELMSGEEALRNIVPALKSLGFNADILYFDFSLEGKEFENQLSFRLWHLLYSFENEVCKTGIGALVDKIMALCNMGEREAKIIANIHLQDDYGSLSSKAMRKILPFLKGGNMYDVACAYAGYRHSKNSLTKEEIENKVLVDKLENLPKNSLRNPVAEKILNLMINVVNECSEKYGRPDEIRVELARELKNSAAERKNISDGISDATKENERIREEIKKKFAFNHVSKTDIVRYKLYMELKPNGFKTLYSNTYIPEDKIFDDSFEIEHIIPKSCLFDDSFSNKTLELSGENKDKGNETAFDFVSRKYDEATLEKYKLTVHSLPVSNSKKKKLLMTAKDIPTDFISRDLKDTQYISKKAKEILESYVRRVISTTGSITDKLRQDWQLVDIMKELNWDKYDRLGMTSLTVNRKGETIRNIKDWTKRNDHRHHAMDALAIAFTKHEHIKYLNTMNAKGELTGMVRNRKFIPPIPLDVFRAEAKRHLEMILISLQSRNKITTSNRNIIKVKGKRIVQHCLTPRIQLHNETIYGRIKQPVVSYVKVGAKLNYESIEKIGNATYRELLKQRLDTFNGDAKKAFTGKNSLAKNPIWLDANSTKAMGEKVKIVEYETIYTTRKPITKDIKIDKVIDGKIKLILKNRLNEYGGNADKAFSNLEDNPIWINEDKGIILKRVTLKGINNAEALHTKVDLYGNTVLDDKGESCPVDFVSTSGNHHVAIYSDAKGELQERCVSFFEAVATKNAGLDVVDKKYRQEDGWSFVFTMKKNEYFVFPNSETGFDPSLVDLTNPDNYSIISPNLFRVQKLATKYYVFRHHLETKVDDIGNLRDITWKRIQNVDGLKGIVKVRINNIGDIVDVGEY